MGLGFGLIEAGLGMSIESVITIIILLAGVILYAADFKLGTLLHFLGFATAFIVFYVLGWNWVLPLIFMLLSLVILALSLYAVSKTTQAGAFI